MLTENKSRVSKKQKEFIDSMSAEACFCIIQIVVKLTRKMLKPCNGYPFVRFIKTVTQKTAIEFTETKEKRNKDDDHSVQSSKWKIHMHIYTLFF